MYDKGPAGQTRPCFGMGKFLLAVVLTFLFLLLGLSMVDRGFFSDGSQQQTRSVSP
jgi:hypothetical protein